MKRDFSAGAYTGLATAMKQVVGSGESGSEEGTGISAYSSLMASLGITSYIDNAKAYTELLIQKNNEAIGKMEKVFEAAHQLDMCYSVRLAAYLALAENLKTLVENFSGVVSPTNGICNPEKLDAFIKEYEKKANLYVKIANNTLTATDLEQYNNQECAKILEDLLDKHLALNPDLKKEEKVEIPIGPGITFYTSVTSTYDGPSNVEIDISTENSETGIPTVSVNGEIGDWKINFTMDESHSPKLEFEGNYSGLAIGPDGISLSAKKQDGDRTHKVTVTAGNGSITYEKSIDQQVTEEISITNACGIKVKKEDSHLCTQPETVKVEVPVEVPIESKLPFLPPLYNKEYEVDYWQAVRSMSLGLGIGNLPSLISELPSLLPELPELLPQLLPAAGF